MGSHLYNQDQQPLPWRQWARRAAVLFFVSMGIGMVLSSWLEGR